MSLWADFLTNDQRIIHKWTHYFPAYERHFSRFRNLSIVMLEIGCGRGGSLQMWKRYFGPFAQIVGIDVRPECKAFEEAQIAVRIGSQSDVQFLNEVVDEFGSLDIVLDDGSHRMSDMVASFRTLYPRLKRNGLYMVEDLHTCYLERFDGGLKKPGTFIELCKDLLDELNADHVKDQIAPTDFTQNTLSMHFYDGIAVFERGRHVRKYAPSRPSRPKPAALRKRG